MTQQSNNNTLFWIAGLGAAYFLYKKYGNPFTALQSPPVLTNAQKLMLPANLVSTSQGIYNIDPITGVAVQTGGVRSPDPITIRTINKQRLTLS